ncbi:PREDICTED: protein kinase and PP2C-like domain-containing protein [Tarenaya hassleriana]|uniref:protein kinase and PP2C-like domain-containing protein n=1 Tax=Tarenaya hassleriana TaxID=28532 RepID=UPI00053CA96D|nr:PREDICTED: protein kinase and PP2C-like domain-containing protein [Tarenaya hassleriana]XP_010541109.1 PREDICTED: protein kinase and PP2C-like domain-containing protein [Tarenaya hassleriana]
MVMEIVEPNTCVRGCCSSKSIPLHLSPSSFSLLSEIARGSESVVYEAILDGRRLAAKKPVLSTSDDLNKFHKHLQLLCKLDHPGVANLVAAHAKPPNYLFFFEFYESGTLAEKLHVEEWSPSIDQVLMITRQLARALLYLHDNGIVHRDVKPANVLLDKNLSPHLADFGLAEYKKDLKEVSLQNWRPSGKPTGGFHKKNMVGTLIYMAPEILKKEIHTEKSDVYSFGILINELLTGVVPYTDLRAEAQAHTVLEMNYTEQQLTAAIVSSGLRPALAESGLPVPETLLSLIQKCWNADPLKRPSFEDIVRELETIWELKRGKEQVQTLEETCISYNDQSVDIIERKGTSRDAINWSIQGESFSKKSSLNNVPGIKFWSGSTDGHLGYVPVLSWGSFATCGRRESMEDTHFLMPHMCNEGNIHLFAIFDGHRGAAAAEFSAQVLPGFLESLSSTSSPADALFQAFVRTDLAFRHELDSHRQSKRGIQRDWHPGCTAIAALVVDNRLFVANVGDSRAMICHAGRPVPLSKVHLATCVEERKRVIAEGGCVEWLVDTWRVVPAGLQVTRSIGDDDLKPAVTAEPEITETVLSADDEFLVMASDGLWDVVKEEEVIRIIKDTVKEPAMCSKRLATEAAERGSGDNITVIVVFLRPVSTAERIF